MDRREFLTWSGAAAAAGLAGAALEPGARAAEPAAPDELVATWNDFCDSLKGAAAPLLRAPAQTPAERASALRYLTRLIRQTLTSTLDYDQATIDQWLQGRFTKYKEYFLGADGPLSPGLLIGEFIDKEGADA